LAGAALISQFHWLLHLFALFLVITGIKMLLNGDEQYDVASNPVLKFMRRHFAITEGLRGQKFFVREEQDGRMRMFVTPLFVALCVIEVADLIFAVDSIPAIFAITTDPFIIFTSNIFAILGLRALFFALAAMIHRFERLKYALAAVLVFIGGKILIADMLGIGEVPPLWSLGVTFAILAAGLVASLWSSSASAEETPVGQ